MITGLEQTGLGQIKQMGASYKLSDTPPRMERPAPALGEHTSELLASIGIADEERERLAQAGVIRTSGPQENRAGSLPPRV
jgi:crotonobetainyl-CoA:carnitine CoA-transferase CaiB-like acyl-CoA transferase